MTDGFLQVTFLDSGLLTRDRTVPCSRGRSQNKHKEPFLLTIQISKPVSGREVAFADDMY